MNKGKGCFDIAANYDRDTPIVFFIFLDFPFRGHGCQERGAIIPV